MAVVTVIICLLDVNYCLTLGRALPRGWIYRWRCGSIYPYETANIRETKVD